MDFEPSYIPLFKKSILSQRVEALKKILQQCTLCPRMCRVNRLKDERSSFCKTGRDAVVSSFFPHFGEERPLVGAGGSGTIFFTHCNLLCSFCQNYDISHEGYGNEKNPQQIARMMIHLQKAGCHNINFVTPTHVVPQIVEALEIAISMGLNLPLVYNCGGYENVETLKLLEGIFDIYMPDFKFWDGSVSKRFTGAQDYPEVARRALKEMHRQVGDLIIDDSGIAKRGILLRHLVMPSNLANTEKIMEFIANEISRNTYVNIMPQYRPCGKVHSDKDAAKPITAKEFESAISSALKAGIKRLDERKFGILLLI